MLVLHLSYTPLAGAPIRLVNALNKFTDFKSRLVNLNATCYGNRTFPEDLVWERDKIEAMDLISRADIIHLHHFFDVDNPYNNYFGIDFKKTTKSTVKYIRQIHSDFDFLVRGGYSRDMLLNDDKAKIVIPHYPERTFRDVYIAPNIIPLNEDIMQPRKISNEIPLVFFSASSLTSMWKERWNTKGVPEVCAKFKQLGKKANFNFQLVQNTPYEMCQKMKAESDIVIGDTTSGSYHLTDLEALAQGKPTFSYLDGRTEFVLQNLLKCDDLPFINTRLEELDLPFIELINNKELRKDIGAFSRRWMEKYYNDKNIIQIYVDVYNKLLNGEEIRRQKELDFPKAKQFLYNDLYDMQWKTRHKKYLGYRYYYAKIKKGIRSYLSSFIKFIRLYVIKILINITIGNVKKKLKNQKNILKGNI